jgi:hypothetical protein
MTDVEVLERTLKNDQARATSMKVKPNVLVVGAGAMVLNLAGWIFPQNS